MFLDTVQYTRRSFQNRNKIKTKNGPRWLTVPLKYAPRDQIINNMEIDNSKKWKSRHLAIIRQSYVGTPYYAEFLPVLESYYEREWNNLSELNRNLSMWIAEVLGVKTRFLRSSELNTTGKSWELILNICLELNATTYISGIGAKTYLDEAKFKANNIDIIYIPPIRIEYDQAYPEIGFAPNLSIADYIFNNGTKDFIATFEKYAYVNEVIKHE